MVGTRAEETTFLSVSVNLPFHVINLSREYLQFLLLFVVYFWILLQIDVYGPSSYIEFSKVFFLSHGHLVKMWHVPSTAFDIING